MLDNTGTPIPVKQIITYLKTFTSIFFTSFLCLERHPYQDKRVTCETISEHGLNATFPHLQEELRKHDNMGNPTRWISLSISPVPTSLTSSAWHYIISVISLSIYGIFYKRKKTYFGVRSFS